MCFFPPHGETTACVIGQDRVFLSLSTYSTIFGQCDAIVGQTAPSAGAFAGTAGSSFNPELYL